MSTGNRLLIVIGGVLVLLAFAAFIAYPLFIRSAPAPVETAPVVTTPSQLNPLPVDSLPRAPEPEVTPTPAQPMSDAGQRAEGERLSRLFIERFGSYSNYSNFENITSLDAFMTDSMRSYAQSLMKKQNQDQGASSYYGVTTQLISVRLDKFEASKSARYIFTVKQDTQIGLNTTPQSVYKDGTLDLVYNNGTWLVQGLFYK